MSANAKIDCYIDPVSPYSFFAVSHLLKNRDALKSQGVEVEFHPMFLNGINAGSGNKPPWTLPARANYLKYDNARAAQAFDMPNLRRPDIFPTKTIQASRGLMYIKAHYPRSVFEETLLNLFRAVWENNENMADQSVLRHVLGKTITSSTELETVIMASESKEWKDAFAANTQTALDSGAYGSPWFMVTNKAGAREPFFGSDRFAYMWRYLGLRFRDVELEDLGVKAKI